MKNLILVWGLIGILVSCQHKPTQVYREESVPVTELTAKELIKKPAVILDARPAFEFNLSHTPGAVNVRWEDFSQSNPMSRGVLESDLFSVARRLSLVGLDPETRVIVLGQGLQGKAEEGRIAWTLKVLGVKEVFTLVHTSYRALNPRDAAPLIKNKPYWKPEVREKLQVTQKDFRVLAAKPQTVVLDVRSSAEFAHRSLKNNKKFKGTVLHVEWKNFFSAEGLPQKSIETILTEAGLSKDSEIILMSNHGVRSGAAAYALDFLGYKKVYNFSGGYEQFH